MEITLKRFTHVCSYATKRQMFFSFYVSTQLKPNQTNYPPLPSEPATVYVMCLIELHDFKLSPSASHHCMVLFLSV